MTRENSNPFSNQTAWRNNTVDPLLHAAAGRFQNQSFSLSHDRSDALLQTSTTREVVPLYWNPELPPVGDMNVKRTTVASPLGRNQVTFESNDVDSVVTLRISFGDLQTQYKISGLAQNKF